MMPRKSMLLFALLSITVVGAQSCGDASPTEAGAQAPDPELDALGLPILDLVGLLQCTALEAAAVSQTVGPEGGVIQVGPHTLSIPAGALADTVTIDAVAPSETVRRVSFAPEGLTFAAPATLTMSYASCNGNGLPLSRQIAYTTDLLVILEYLLSLDDRDSRTVTTNIDHFSSYAVAW